MALILGKSIYQRKELNELKDELHIEEVSSDTPLTVIPDLPLHKFVNEVKCKT